MSGDGMIAPESLNASDVARALAARRRRSVFVCTVCGAEFETLARPKQLPRTCSPKCRQSRWRQAQKTKTPAPGD